VKAGIVKPEETSISRQRLGKRGLRCNGYARNNREIFRNIEFSDYIHRPGIKKTNQGKHDVSETGTVSVLRCGKNPILLGPLERAIPNHWTTDVTNHTGYKYLRPG
jgi:hypothetical protein